MTTQEIKFNIIRQLIDLEDNDILFKIRTLLESINGKTKNDLPIEEDFDATKMSFEEWNKQFTDEADLDQYLPDYNMTMGAFRMKIYESERAESITYEELGQEIESWINE